MRYSRLCGLICAFVFGLYSVTNASAGLIIRQVGIAVHSYSDSNGYDCTGTCGWGFIDLIYDPNDLLNTFRYYFTTEGNLTLINRAGGPGYFDCQAPQCERFTDILDAVVGLNNNPQAENGFVGIFRDFSNNPFSVDLTTIGVFAHPFEVEFEETLTMNRFSGEWFGERDGGDFRATFTVPEPPVLPIFLLGLFVVIAHGVVLHRPT